MSLKFPNDKQQKTICCNFSRNLNFERCCYLTEDRIHLTACIFAYALLGWMNIIEKMRTSWVIKNLSRKGLIVIIDYFVMQNNVNVMQEKLFYIGTSETIVL